MIEKDISLRKGKVHYLEAGTGRHLILLHGWPLVSIPMQYSGLIEMFAGDFHVIIPHLPGFGLSEQACEPTLEGYSFFLEEFISALRLEDVAIAGYSFGGLVSLKYASRNPLPMRKLVLIGTDIRYSIDTLVRFLIGMPVQMYKRIPSAWLREYIRNSIFVNNPVIYWLWKRAFPADKFIFEDSELLAAMMSTPPSVSMEVLDLILNRNLERDASRIMAKTFIINGRRDAIAGVDAGRRLSSAIKNSEILINNEQHCCLMNRLAATTMLSFLKG